MAAMVFGIRLRSVRRGTRSEASTPTSPPRAAQLAAAMAENPLCSRSASGIHAPRL